MSDAAELDPVGFVADELSGHGALVERDGDRALAILPRALAGRLDVAETIAIAVHPAEGHLACGLGAPLLDRLLADVSATVPVARVTWQAEPPRLATAERLVEGWGVRNGVVDVLGVAHASATYLAGVFSWTVEADDRYDGLIFVAAHGVTGSEPDAQATAAFACVIAGCDPRVIDEDDLPGAARSAGTVARRAAEAIGPRLAEVGAAVARRRDRERGRIDEYFGSLVAEARRPRRQVARDAIDARVAALHAEHAAKRSDLDTR